ncbi:MAG: glycosyltransferase family 4 protein [Acetobacteraceae bacterium]
MRIAVTHPTCWPEVRRGSERLLHDLAHWLAGRGHAVTVISTGDGPGGTERDGEVERLLLPRRHPLPRHVRWWNFFHAFAGQLRDVLHEREFDAVHCLNYHDAWGASLARRRGARFRLVFQLTGIPMRRYFRRIPLDGLIFRAALRRSDEVLALSRFALERLQDQYGRAGTLVPAPTDLRPYAAVGRSAFDKPAGGDPGGSKPAILFVGDVDEPRKGALLLAQAMRLLHDRGFTASLGYSGRAGDAVRTAILAALPEPLRARVTFHGLGRTEDLPELYAGATVVVNPAVWEAQGMVLVEALAAGTPVVGCRHAGTTDIVADDRIGRLFDPGTITRAASNAAGLADAIAAAAALAGCPATARLCRERAAAFSWDRLGPLYEAALCGAVVEAAT